MLSVASDEENSTEELFNNERMLFDSVEQESFEEGNENKIETYEIDKKEEIDTPEILFLSQDLDGTDNEVEEILSDEKNSVSTFLTKSKYAIQFLILFNLLLVLSKCEHWSLKQIIQL